MAAPRNAFPRSLRKLYDFLDYYLAEPQQATADAIAAKEAAELAQTGAESAQEAAEAIANTMALATSFEELETTNAEATVLSLEHYGSNLTTSGSEGAEDAEIGDGTDAIIGQRKLVVLKTRTHESDSVVLDHANIVSEAGVDATSVELDEEGEFVLLEWNGAKWQVVYSSAGVVATA